MPGIKDADKYFIVSIDVEEDMPNWGIEDTITIRNLGGIPRLQELFDKYNIRPTYLLNYAFASNETAVTYFNSISEKCEIGAHMHPWNTPPLTENEERINDYPSNLAYERQYEKIKAVTDALTSAFQKSPTSYRAGRFGFNEDTKDILDRLGYIVDSSVSPMVSWAADNGPSYLNYRAKPFTLESPHNNILEVPVTIGLNRNIPQALEWIYLRLPQFMKLRGLLSKDYLNIIDLIWLYPAVFSAQEMIALVDVMMKKSLNVFNVFFHSSEVAVGESIYTKSEEELNNYLKRLELLIDYAMNEKGMKSVTLSEYKDHYED